MAAAKPHPNAARSQKGECRPAAGNRVPPASVAGLSSQTCGRFNKKDFFAEAQ